MPYYDYVCPKCNKMIEIERRMTETPEVKCPDCNALMFHLLGSGIRVKCDWNESPLRDNPNVSRERLME